MSDAALDSQSRAELGAREIVADGDDAGLLQWIGCNREDGPRAVGVQITRRYFE